MIEPIFSNAANSSGGQKNHANREFTFIDNLNVESGAINTRKTRILWKIAMIFCGLAVCVYCYFLICVSMDSMMFRALSFVR